MIVEAQVKGPIAGDKSENDCICPGAYMCISTDFFEQEVIFVNHLCKVSFGIGSVKIQQ